MSEEIIKQLFKSYVDSKHDLEYHSQECVDAEIAMTDLIYKYVKDDEAALEIILAAINLAGKYEESGYIAGFKREPLAEVKAVAL